MFLVYITYNLRYIIIKDVRKSYVQISLITTFYSMKIYYTSDAHCKASMKIMW